MKILGVKKIRNKISKYMLLNYKYCHKGENKKINKSAATCENVSYNLYQSKLKTCR